MDTHSMSASSPNAAAGCFPMPHLFWPSCMPKMGLPLQGGPPYRCDLPCAPPQMFCGPHARPPPLTGPAFMPKMPPFMPAPCGPHSMPGRGPPPHATQHDVQWHPSMSTTAPSIHRSFSLERDRTPLSQRLKPQPR